MSIWENPKKSTEQFFHVYFLITFKLVRKFLITPWAVCLVAVSFLAVSCQSPKVMPQTSTAQHLRVASDAHSAEELFKGILFLQGPVADAVPELEAMKTEHYIHNVSLLEKVETVQNTTFSYFVEKYPNYLETFKANIESGNQVLIQETLQDATEKLKVVSTELYGELTAAQQQEGVQKTAAFNNALSASGIDQNNPEAVAAFIDNYFGQSGDIPNNATGAVLFLPVAVIAAVVIALLAAVVNGVVIAANSTYRTGDSNTLAGEELVNIIATQLNK